MKKLLIAICCLCLFGKAWGEDIVLSDPPEGYIPLPDSVLDSIPYLYQFMEIPPTFQGGDVKFFTQWVEKKVNHKNSQQKDAIRVRIFVKIIIDTVGSISEVTVLRSNDEKLSNKVVEVIKSSPKWTPGMESGRLVQTSCLIPLTSFFVDKKKN